MLLAEIGWGQITLAGVVTVISFLLICLVLLQKNRGSGLSGAFGGAGGQSAFGTKTGDVLTWITVGLTAVFLLLCVLGNWMFVPESAAQTTPDSGQVPPPAPTASGPGTPGTPAQRPSLPPRPPAMQPSGAAPRTSAMPTGGATPTPLPAERPPVQIPPASGPAGS